MRAFRDLSIRHKLTLLLLSVAGIVLLATSLANVISEVRSTRELMIGKHTTLAKVVAAQSAAALSLADIDPSGARQILSDLSVEPTVHFAALYNAQGNEVARFPPDSQLAAHPPETIGGTFTDDGFLDIVEEVKLSDGTVIGRLYLRHTIDQLRSQIRRIVFVAVVNFFIALAAAFLLSFVLQRFISAPVLQLAELTNRVSTEYNYALRAQKLGDDELGALCDEFNTMLAEIQRRDSELEQHRQNLEALVEQRTQVLEDRTRELTHSNELLARSRQELEAANKELEAFSYSVSHDLRAPLRAIDGFSRILINDYAAELSEEAREFLQDVRTNTQQMGQLVDDLLAFSRLSRQPIKKQPVDQNQLVAHCLQELRSELGDRQVNIHVQDLPPSAADPALLKQVWTNFLSNAFKYTGRCEVAEIEVGSRPGETPDSQTFYVRDNGVGFDMRYVHKVFGVFQRLHKAEDYPGTGVGLAIVQRIIHRHGGRVWAESEPGRGAAFYFSLPRDKDV